MSIVGQKRVDLLGDSQITSLGSEKNKRSCTPTACLLPDDALYLIFEKLDSELDQQSFGLTCHSFLDIQNTSRKCLRLGCVQSLYCSYDHAAIFRNAVNIETLLKRFSQLQSLCLGCCIRVSDSCLELLLEYCSKLHSLYLDKCYYLTDIGLASVASGCQLLSSISLSECSVTDSGLEILTKLCKALKEVNLDGCIDITDNGIRSLNQNCRQLRSLNISSCDRVNGEGFKGFSTLACLEAYNCEFYSMKDVDDAIIEISKGCPLLQEWNLSFCEKIGISGWESIGLYCKNLKIIHVNGCRNLDDRGLLSLGDGCKRLSMIYRTAGDKITRSGLLLLKEKREDVEIIYYKIKKDIPPSWAFTGFKNNH
ncbi:leucine-rich repeat domain, L domain-like protein [Artemisia annua]|uniref:Leucine-rich repeat domain, L domain-like protein n=1 Tax=Artemisia annua TaxID=35608 RepID=A0A2U1NM66_ARTAN|nr:leucine-rich repeat domain, L domain-like protein [Artemisia annua]